MQPVIKENSQEVKDYIKKQNIAAKKAVEEMAKTPWSFDQVMEQAERLRKERKERIEEKFE